MLRDRSRQSRDTQGSESKLKFGLLYDFRNPAQWYMPPAELYASRLEQIQAAEDLGYDSIWVTEHHFIDDGYLPCMSPAMAAIAMKTKRVTIGSFVMLLPLHNPIAVAEEAAVVDALSNGRLILGVGQGYRLQELNVFGVPPAERGEYFEEGIEVIKRCWAPEAQEYKGRIYHLPKVSVTPKPVQQPHPPLWIGARGIRAVRRAARMSDGWLSGGATAEHYEAYLQTLAEVGKRREDVVISAYRQMYVAPTTEQAWAEVGPHLLYTFNNYRRWYAEANDLPGDSAPLATDPKDVPQGWAIVGSPDEVAAEIERYNKEVQIDHVVACMQFPGLAPDKALAAIELLAREVVPRFRAA